MDELILITQIIAPVIMLCGSYAAIMSLLKKELNYIWFRAENLLALVGGSLAISFSFLNTSINESLMYTLALAFLHLSFFAILVQLIYSQKLFKKNKGQLAKEHLPKAILLAVIAFGAVLLHLFLVLAAIAWY